MNDRLKEKFVNAIENVLVGIIVAIILILVIGFIGLLAYIWHLILG